MKLLCKDEIKTLRLFMRMPIPEYIYKYDSAEFDLMDCYEVAFTYAIGLLHGEKVNPQTSPWGNGKSVIFAPDYTELLLNIQSSALDLDIKD